MVVKIPKLLKKKSFTDALGGQEDLAMESYVAEPTLRNKLPNWQPSTSPTHRPPSAKKAKNDLANKRSREQVTHAQARALLMMAQTTWMKAQILQNNATQQLFVSISIP
jgi:hypothetical protein